MRRDLTPIQKIFDPDNTKRERFDGDAGGWNRNGDQKNNYNEEEPQKPRKIYILVERVTDGELFTATITSGVNFMKLDDIEMKVTGQNSDIKF